MRSEEKRGKVERRWHWHIYSIRPGRFPSIRGALGYVITCMAFMEQAPLCHDKMSGARTDGDYPYIQELYIYIYAIRYDTISL